MVETVKIGNSWYVVEDICGIVGPQPNDAEAKLLMRGGHILKMTDLGEDVIEYIRQLRAGEIAPPQKPNSQPTMEVMPPPASYTDFVAAGGKIDPSPVTTVTDVDMAPAEDIPT